MAINRTRTKINSLNRTNQRDRMIIDNYIYISHLDKDVQY